jgi:hypothetical protein
MAQYTINTRPSHTTKIPPYEILIGTVPRAQLTLLQTEAPQGTRKEQLITLRQKAHDTILHSQMMMIKDTNFVTLHKGDQVWLDAKNLKMTHPMHKLWSKWYGPFNVAKAISHVAYQF